jgi:hypothetical protein
MHGRHPHALFGGFSDELRIAPEIIPVCVDFRRLIRDVNLRTIMRRAGAEILTAPEFSGTSSSLREARRFSKGRSILTSFPNLNV